MNWDLFVIACIFAVCVGPHAVVLLIENYQDNRCPMHDPAKTFRRDAPRIWSKPYSPADA